jgi:hypothetical protein
VGLRDWWGGASEQPDGFALPANHPRRNEHEMLSAVLREAAETQIHDRQALAGCESFRRILDADSATSVRLVQAASERSRWDFSFGSNSWSAWRLAQFRQADTLAHMRAHAVLSATVDAIARRPMSWSSAERVVLLDALRGRGAECRTLMALLPPEGSAIPDDLRAALNRLKSSYVTRAAAKDMRKLAVALDDLLSGDRRAALDATEPWISVVEPALARDPWKALGRHLADASSTKLSAKWKREAERLIAAVGEDEVRARAVEWVRAASDGGQPAVGPRNGDFLRGLLWCIARRGDAESARLIGDTALAVSRKIRNIGMRSPKVLNACIALLGELADSEALAQLTRLRTKVKGQTPQALISRTMEAAARGQGMSLADLEEIVVPTFGLDANGCSEQPIGEHVATVRVAGSDRVDLTWRTADGRAQKSVPAAVRQEHADALAALKRTVRDLTAMLAVQRERIEQLLLAERVLSYAAWRERYLDHPLVGQFARRLIWHFDDGTSSAVGAWDSERIVDATDTPLDWLGSSTRVRLWHPIGFDIDTITSWRRWLERHEVVQPFKQAHREVYLITDAELVSGTYSNRFAAHIVRQHQFAALCKARGWRYRLQGSFDGANTPTLELPARNLRAEFWVEPCEDRGEAIAPYASTDQVRFVAEGGIPVELADVPALVFSEVMRDVDLFVGVASVGTDPTWMDAGHRPDWNAYWQRFAFGDLSQTAESRREVIERLLPKLSIASRGRVEGKFLYVRGDIRTYKIHLGSGNILMEPNDQYLCIVPARSSAAERVWVPFEGDGTLSVILSKAFLLAKDTTITDETMLRQIRR